MFTFIGQHKVGFAVAGAAILCAIAAVTTIGCSVKRKKDKALKEKLIAENKARLEQIKKENDRKKIPDLDAAMKSLDYSKDDDFNRYMHMCTVAQKLYEDWMQARAEYDKLLTEQRNLEARYWKAYSEWSTLASADFDGEKYAGVEKLGIAVNEMNAKVREVFFRMKKLEGEYYDAAAKRDSLYSAYEESLKKFQGAI